MNYQIEKLEFVERAIALVSSKRIFSVMVIVSMVLSTSASFLMFPSVANASTDTSQLIPSAIGNYNDWSQTGGAGANTDAKKN